MLVCFSLCVRDIVPSLLPRLEIFCGRRYARFPRRGGTRGTVCVGIFLGFSTGVDRGGRGGPSPTPPLPVLLLLLPDRCLPRVDFLRSARLASGCPWRKLRPEEGG